MPIWRTGWGGGAPGSKDSGVRSPIDRRTFLIRVTHEQLQFGADDSFASQKSDDLMRDDLSDPTSGVRQMSVRFDPDLLLSHCCPRLASGSMRNKSKSPKRPQRSPRV